MPAPRIPMGAPTVSSVDTAFIACGKLNLNWINNIMTIFANLMISQEFSYTLAEPKMRKRI